MKLAELLYNAGIEAELNHDEKSLCIEDITDDSRRIERNSLFVAVRGEKFDGHLFLSDVIEKGAIALIVEQDIPKYPKIPVIKVSDTRIALASLSQAFYGNPAQKIENIGITGTNGKTTGTYLIEGILKAGFGGMIGRIGTIEYNLGGEIVVANNTTPSSLALAKYYARMAENGVKYCVMEVSSHGLEQHRVYGIPFKVGVFTNLTQDHLDYHLNLNNYREAKWRLFTEYVSKQKDGVAVFNLDDETGRNFSSRYKGRQITYALKTDADCVARDIHFSTNKTTFSLVFYGEVIEMETSLTGLFNISNILAAFAAGYALNIPPEKIRDGIASVKKVPGRFELIDAGQPFFTVVDYSHTPDALRVALENARAICKGNIYVVFGCGGNRDKTKRPIMGLTVGNASGVSRAIITNDNPRKEKPEEIAAMVLEGIKRSKLADFEIILDRREAIHKALSLAKKDDLVLIAGKGHEDYQIIGETKHPFDDRVEAMNALRNHKWK